MPRFAQLIVGPAGSGKSSYVSAMVKHGESIKRTMHAINLDPAAEHFDYEPIADIRDLIKLDDVMNDEEFMFGPNGGLVFAMEFLLENRDWLQEQLGEDEDDYILIDFPGQIELSTHLNVVRDLILFLQSMNFRVCAVFLLDCQFISDVSKFFSGVMVGLATIVNLEVPTINLLTKTDLLDKNAKKQLQKFLDPDSFLLDEPEFLCTRWGEKFRRLTEAFAKLIDDYSLINFYPVNIFDEESLNDVLLNVDNAIQYGEDQDVRVTDFDEPPIHGDNGLNAERY